MANNYELVEKFELISSKAWPAEDSRNLDGWTLRSSKGVTWRANSVLPFSSLINLTLDEAIESVVQYYQERNLIPAFKLTYCCHPTNLDKVLDSKGFKKEMETYVQIAPLNNGSSESGRYSVKISEMLKQDWVSAYFKLGEFTSFELENRIDIIKRIQTGKAFASVRAGGMIVGIGMGVIVDQALGLFGIITDPHHRGKGVGSSINAALMSWGKERGASVAYLQVEKENTPALSLYSKCGFSIIYDYWYRILR
ncbi:MAG: GNAT family N-acetyltransferase [Candidatus Thorarchaeota archaeon]